MLLLQMQQAEMEARRQREADITALAAIGPRKKPRLDQPGAAGASASPDSPIAAPTPAGAPDADAQASTAKVCCTLTV